MPPGRSTTRLPLWASALWEVRFRQDLGLGAGEAEAKRLFLAVSLAADTLFLLPHNWQGGDTWCWENPQGPPARFASPLHLLPCSVRHQHAVLHLFHFLPWATDAC